MLILPCMMLALALREYQLPSGSHVAVPCMTLCWHVDCVCSEPQVGWVLMATGALLCRHEDVWQQCQHAWCEPAGDLCT